MAIVSTMKHVLARTLYAAVLSLWFIPLAWAGFVAGSVTNEHSDIAPFIGGPTLDNKQAYATAKTARSYLQAGHDFKRIGKYAKAIESYEKALAFGDEQLNYAVESSLREAKRLHGYENILKEYFPSCRSEINCMNEHFIFEGRPVHPLIIDAFLGGLSDVGPLITGVNLSPAQTSNQFCCESSYEWTVNSDGHSVVSIDYIEEDIMTEEDCWNGCGLGYEFLGSTTNGIQLLKIWKREGGTLVSRYLMLLKTQNEFIYDDGWENNWVIKHKGYLAFGEKAGSDVKIQGNQILLNDEAIELPSIKNP